jgi:hypothetical protein
VSGYRFCHDEKTIRIGWGALFEEAMRHEAEKWGKMHEKSSEAVREKKKSKDRHDEMVSSGVCQLLDPASAVRKRQRTGYTQTIMPRIHGTGRRGSSYPSFKLLLFAFGPASSDRKFHFREY